MKIEDVVSDETQEIRRQTGEWSFVGFYEQRGKEHAFPIGVYDSYEAGRVVANAWMKNTNSAVRWEAMKLHVKDET